ncbi:MAG: hypothetical protein WDW38_000510 [Sanguina aurantia]
MLPDALEDAFVSQNYTIFYKKTGAMFGNEICLASASLMGPALAQGADVPTSSRYFEYEIKRLKPSSLYVVKIKASDGGVTLRSDKMSTISLEEERTRNVDMANFAGALIKLGDTDAQVQHFSPESGLFEVRVLRMDDLKAGVQLLRFASDYTDAGRVVQAHTLSEIKFGRWGGEIKNSRVVPEGELKWLAARAVQAEERSEVAAGFDARVSLMSVQAEKVTSALEQDTVSRLSHMRSLNVTYLLFACLMAALAVAAPYTVWARNASFISASAAAQLAARSQVMELQEELSSLALYKLSLQLDTQHRILAAGSSSGSSGSSGSSRASQTHRPPPPTTPTPAPAPTPAPTPSATTTTTTTATTHKPGRAGDGAAPDPGAANPDAACVGQGCCDGGCDGGVGGGGCVEGVEWSGVGGECSPGDPRRVGAGGPGHHAKRGHSSWPEVLSEDHIGNLLSEGRGRQRRKQQQQQQQEGGGSGNSRGPGLQEGMRSDAPDAAGFIELVSNQYALYLREWVALRLQEVSAVCSIRTAVNDMLPSTQQEQQRHQQPQQ